MPRRLRASLIVILNLFQDPVHPWKDCYTRGMSAFIFDFDGTIADSFETVIQIFHELTGRHDRLPDAEIERLRGMTLRQVAKDLHIQVWKVPYLLMKGRRTMNRQMEQVHAHRGVPEVIRKLFDEGHQLFIVSSNSTKNIELFLQQHNLSKEFVSIYGGVGLLSKARMLRRVARRNSLEPEDTWYVGDEVRDIEGAHQAGLKVVAVAWGYNTAAILQQHRPTKLVHNPSELLQLLEMA